MNEREREKGRGRVEKSERSDGEAPLAGLDNEMDALGCVVAKQK